MASSNHLQHSWLATTIADLESIHVAPLDDGTKCWVDATHENYYLSRTSGLAVDGVNIIAPSAQAAAGEPNAKWLSSLAVGGGAGGVSGSASMVTDQPALNSATFAPVPELTVTLAVGAGLMDIEYDITGIAVGGGGDAIFRAVIDGTEVQIGAALVTRSQCSGGAVATAVASARIPVTAGTHTVIVEYECTGGAVLTIAPTVGREHGTLNVREVVA